MKTTAGQAQSLFPPRQPEEGRVQHAPGMPWIGVTKGNPYFSTDAGAAWTPIGQNDAITWPNLKGIFLRKDVASANRYFALLAQSGVTCLRLMLEYCHGEHRYLEAPAGYFQPNMIRLWDDLFLLCEKYGLRILLTPYDTFWMWRRWRHHPYRHTNGGPCARRNEWLLCPKTRAAIKNRLRFATERWGGSGALFAWDLWNEIHPAHSRNSTASFYEFIEDISSFLRSTEHRLHGRAHPQTVSVFNPSLAKHPEISACAFNHPSLDFATLHFYERPAIDSPRNAVDAALATGRLTRQALLQIGDNRPFFDSEHGPIHTFNNRRKTLAEPFDDLYFRYMQWAHIASGGAGGGLRWPYRHPHCLTAGMRQAQQALARFIPLIDWSRFERKNRTGEVIVSDAAVVPFACGDQQQAVVWLLRTATKKSRKNKAVQPIAVALPALAAGHYNITVWNTATGAATHTFTASHTGGELFQLPMLVVESDRALAVKRCN